MTAQITQDCEKKFCISFAKYTSEYVIKWRTHDNTVWHLILL